jgi:hypothetical protein
MEIVQPAAEQFFPFPYQSPKWNSLLSEMSLQEKEIPVE